MRMLEMLQNYAMQRSDKTIYEYIDADGAVVAVSYAQFYNDMIKLAAYLQKKYGTGNHIGFLAGSSYVWHLYYYAVQFSGNVAIMYNYSLELEEMVSLMKLSDTSHILFDENYAQFYEEISGVCQVCGIKAMAVEEIRAISDKEEKDYVPVDEKQVSMMLFSSGTSGDVKAIKLSVENVKAYSDYDIEEIKEEKRVLCLFPVYHSASFCVILFAMKKGYIYCVSRETKYMFKDIEAYLPENIYGVPAMAKAIVTKRKKGDCFLDRLSKKPEQILTAGAPLPEEVKHAVEAQGIQMGTFYGMTEVGNVTELGSGDVKTVGWITPNKEVKVDEGEICVRGKNVMLGYYKNEEETREVLDKDGWMHTGDVGYVDENNYLYITGRKKNIIILSNGKNVSPEAIESKLMKIPYIKEVVVLAVGEYIGAQIYCEQLENLEMIESNIREEIHKYNVTVPTYEQIRKVEFRTEEFEKTSTGKIKRFTVSF